MVICDLFYINPVKSNVIGKVVRYTNTHEMHIPELLNEDGNWIDTGLIIITQKRQVCKNDINAMMVSWRQLVTSVDKYITIVSTILVTAVTHLEFEYRSVHDGNRRGFTVKPTTMYVDECMDIVQLRSRRQRVIQFNIHYSELLLEVAVRYQE